MLLDCTDRNEKWYCQHGMIVTDSSTPFLQIQKPEKSPRRTPQAPEVGNNATTKPSLPRNARCRAHCPELRVAKAHRLVHNHSHAASEVSHSRASATSGPGATRAGNVCHNAPLSRGVRVCRGRGESVDQKTKERWGKKYGLQHHSFLSGLPRQYLRWPYAA